MNRKFFITLCIAAVMVGGVGCMLAACSDDDDDSHLGEQEVADLKALLLDAQGQIAFDMEENSEMYQIGVKSLDDAINLASLYAGKGFNGQAYTRKLADNKGKVAVKTGDNGVFYQVDFDVVGIPSFILNIIDGDQGGNAFSIYHTCNVCGFSWKSTLNRCPREGNKAYHP